MKIKKKNIFGLDLGSANTIIYSITDDQILFNEPSVVAKDVKTGSIIDIGYLANKLEGRNPYNIKVSKFVVNGLLFSRVDALSYIKHALKAIQIEKDIRGSVLILACADDLSQVHQEALISIAKEMDIKAIFLESISKLTALGSGLNLSSMQGNLIVNIGAGSTNIGIVASGEVVKSKTIALGGDNYDKEIARYIKNKWHSKIGLKTAEYIKIKIGNLDDQQENKALEVKGQDIITGLPHKFIITSKELYQPISKVSKEIVYEIQETMEDVLPELISDISTNGITLSGGSALLQGSRKFYQKELSLPCFTSPTPLLSVVKGMKELIDQKN